MSRFGGVLPDGEMMKNIKKHAYSPGFTNKTSTILMGLCQVGTGRKKPAKKSGNKIVSGSS
jgi:hypothetical protein